MMSRWLKERYLRWSLYFNRRPDYLETIFDFKSKDPHLNGIFPNPAEKSIDYPKCAAELEKSADRIFFVGFHSNGSSLLASVERHKDGTAERSLMLRLPDGKVYVLPNNEVTIDQSGDDEFVSAGLKLICVLPIRKWRIVYNGIMKELTEDGSLSRKETFVHLGFFVHQLSSSVDYRYFLDENFLAYQLSNTDFNGDINKNLDRLRIHMSSMYFAGRAVVDGEEYEMFLWGFKQRSNLLDADTIESFGSIMAVSENGIRIHLKDLRIPGFTNRLTIGHAALPMPQETPIQCIKPSNLLEKQDTCPETFSVTAGSHAIEVENKNLAFRFTMPLRVQGYVYEVPVAVYSAAIDGNVAWVLHICAKDNKNILTRRPKIPTCIALAKKSKENNCGSNPRVVSFEDTRCLLEYLTGGKGSSLSMLAHVAQRVSSHKAFKVPNGVVVSTEAYATFSAQEEVVKQIKAVQTAAVEDSIENLRIQCEKAVKEISKVILPIEIQEELKKTISELFEASDCFATNKFAVRSSACGEDSEDMSAAGQMQTFLGVKGFHEICAAVVKCWASQFGFVAVQYKKRYGLEINSKMAVVVQQMIESDVSGVMFTCDPISGDPRFLTITANYGLGEVMVVPWNKRSKKKKQKKLCIEESDILKLARVGVAVEKAYSSLRDIEWAFKDGVLHLLQSRPVTSLDRESEFELKHEMDAGNFNEWEAYSKANAGEVFGLCPVPLNAITTIGGANQYEMGGDGIMSKGFSIAMSGRAEEDDSPKRCRENKAKYELKQKRPGPGGMFGIKIFWQAEKILQGAEKYMTERKDLPINDSDPKTMYLNILKDTEGRKTLEAHGQCIFYSSIANMINLYLLAHTEGDFTNRVFGDFAKLTQSCNNVVSADVPLTVQNMAVMLEEEISPEEFKSMNANEALEWIKTRSVKTKPVFEKFIEDHGHRCLGELDIGAVDWKMDPSPVVKTLQGLIGNVTPTVREEVDVSKLVDSLEIKMNFFKRMIMKKLGVWLCRNGITYRERAKSTFVFSQHYVRWAIYRLGEQMYKHGLLPDVRLIYYFEPWELWTVLERGKRAPTIISKAYARRQIYENEKTTRYKEISIGIPQPEKQIKVQTIDGKKKMKGTPVSQGAVTARACVISRLEDAHQIQKGDVLITYATDIGWSPYFPLLSGIATELGGLISHGAVVAREYGIPCVVAVHGATNLFETGETVLLDGNKGIVQTVEIAPQGLQNQR